MLEFNELLQLLDKITQSSLEEVHLEHGSLKLSVKKSSGAVVTKQVPVVKEVPVPVQETFQPAEVTVQKSEDLKVIKSPMVGTFYSKSSPTAEDFVKVGTKVDKNTTVCIIEAMKLFNEILSDFNGEIAEIHVENGQLVEYGQPLFSVR